MVRTVSITVAPSQEHDERLIRRRIADALRGQGITLAPDAQCICQKRSVDARHKNVRLVLRYAVYSGDHAEPAPAQPRWQHVGNHSPCVVIVGSGPAGLFGALTLLEHGIRPVIVERGRPVHDRKRDIAAISTSGTVDAESNYCFGEGGAGTFSDGKLYTRSNKRGDVPQVLSLFARFGADPRILTDAHPHIGTDRLPAVVQAMRNTIEEHGGQFLFSTKCTGLVTDTQDGGTIVRGITVVSQDGAARTLVADAVLLATGHSAADVYAMVAKAAPQALQAKTFAVGVRVEHPREHIDRMQYHGRQDAATLGAAEYRFTSQQDGRGTYSFCMCPGGFVVPSATAPGQLVVNGMSAAGRNSAWSNAAFVVETRPEDIPAPFAQRAKEQGVPALAGLYWRTALEEETARHAQGQKAPAQLLTDFLACRDSTALPRSSYAPGLVPSRLDAWLPAQVATRLKGAFYEADKKMPGFIYPEAVLIASETRTSTPVRILRDADGQCTALGRLYPAGEGSGYAGGIVSSAMDGIKACTAIARAITQSQIQTAR